jgi:hypothetical protein
MIGSLIGPKVLWIYVSPENQIKGLAVSRCETDHPDLVLPTLSHPRGEANFSWSAPFELSSAGLWIQSELFFLVLKNMQERPETGLICLHPRFISPRPFFWLHQNEPPGRTLRELRWRSIEVLPIYHAGYA